MSQLSTFSTPLGTLLRTLTIDGNPWFIAKDVCDALGQNNNREALTILDADRRNTVRIPDGKRGKSPILCSL